MSKKILYCVLNWGLGHASRSTPIIRNLLDKGNDVIIASDGLAYDLLKKQFPLVETMQLPSYNIKYKYDSISLNILHQAMKFIRAKKAENVVVSNIVAKYEIEDIISDNRFGCYHKDCKNIFITHQIRLVHPNKVLGALGTRMNIIFIENFDECWVPDYPDENNLSGEMAHGIQLKIPIKFIGIKSRFNKLKISEKPEFNTVTILSGPEPQRSVLEEIIKDKLQSITGPHAIITGLKIENFTKGNIDFFGLLDEKEISAIISDSKYIISRSGYSSIMDYEAMCRKAILIPTPGQTEQIYLAENAIKNRRHLVQYQNSLNLEALIV